MGRCYILFVIYFDCIGRILLFTFSFVLLCFGLARRRIIVGWERDMIHWQCGDSKWQGEIMTMKFSLEPQSPSGLIL